MPSGRFKANHATSLQMMGWYWAKHPFYGLGVPVVHLQANMKPQIGLVPDWHTSSYKQELPCVKLHSQIEYIRTYVRTRIYIYIYMYMYVYVYVYMYIIYTPCIPYIRFFFFQTIFVHIFIEHVYKYVLHIYIYTVYTPYTYHIWGAAHAYHLPCVGQDLHGIHPDGSTASLPEALIAIGGK